jgi:hypothetical protein
MQAYDDDFKAFNEERQKRFDTEFEDWRKKRMSGSEGQSGQGAGQGSMTGGTGRSGEGSQGESASSKKT